MEISEGIMSNLFILIGLFCLCLFLGVALILIALKYKKNEAIKVDLQYKIDALNAANERKETVLRSLLNTGNALYDLSEQSGLDALSRLTQLRTILFKQFPWGKNLNQEIILTKIFSGMNREKITPEDVYRIRQLQKNIESFRRLLSQYSYPLENNDILKLRAQYLQLSMLTFDVLDSLSEHPNYFKNQQGINVDVFLKRENNQSPHKVTTLEDKQERWALIMKGVLDGIELDKNIPLVFCGYEF